MYVSTGGAAVHEKFHGLLLLGNNVAPSSMCVFSSHLFWTSRSLDVPAGVTQEEGHTGFSSTFLVRCVP